jgi:hypothetical protein
MPVVQLPSSGPKLGLGVNERKLPKATPIASSTTNTYLIDMQGRVNQT